MRDGGKKGGKQRNKRNGVTVSGVAREHMKDTVPNTTL